VRKLELFWYFLAGSFHFNGIPHLVKGITGQTHMTPFKRVSSPVLNVIWAFVNFAFAFLILGMVSSQGGLVLPWGADLSGMNLLAYFGGGFVTAAYLANFWSNPNARLPWQKD